MAQTRPLVLTARPTPEFRRHHDVEDPRVDERSARRAWIVRTRLDQLLADGMISRGQWQAAVEYRDAWARVYAQGGGSEPGGMRVSGAANDGHQRMLDRLDTLTRLRITEQRLGGLATWLVYRCVVEDMTWREMGKRAGNRDHKTMRRWTADALRLLAPAWAKRRPRTNVARIPQRW